MILFESSHWKKREYSLSQILLLIRDFNKNTGQMTEKALYLTVPENCLHCKGTWKSGNRNYYNIIIDCVDIVLFV